MEMRRPSAVPCPGAADDHDDDDDDEEQDEDRRHLGVSANARHRQYDLPKELKSKRVRLCRPGGDEGDGLGETQRRVSLLWI